MAWGYNDDGQLGNGATNNSNVPVLVSGLTNAVQVSATSYSSAALTSAGSVWCWGNGANGELGNGAYANHFTPVQTSNLTSIVSIASGNYGQVLALKSDGTVWSWVDNSYGELEMARKNHGTELV